MRMNGAYEPDPGRRPLADIAKGGYHAGRPGRGHRGGWGVSGGRHHGAATTAHNGRPKRSLK
eukprot:7174386-Prymnesium_polylepis.1